jgi:transposase
MLKGRQYPGELRERQAGSDPQAVKAAEDSAEVRRLKADNRELRRANEIVKAAAGFFAAELDRPHKNW